MLAHSCSRGSPQGLQLQGHDSPAARLGQPAAIHHQPREADPPIAVGEACHFCCTPLSLWQVFQCGWRRECRQNGSLVDGRPTAPFAAGRRGTLGAHEVIRAIVLEDSPQLLHGLRAEGASFAACAKALQRTPHV